MPHQINTEICSGCGACFNACPVDAIIKREDNSYQVNPDECVDCDTCWRICPNQCIDGNHKMYLELRTEKND